MRIIGRYILTSFVVTFAASLTVLTFVMSIGVVFKITDLIARGVPWWPILKIFGLAMPGALSFAIPVSLLATSLLVFSRLSADSEITAMKVCGISMWSIVSSPLLLSLLLGGVCLAINSIIAPKTVGMRRAAVAELGVMSPADLLEEGRFINDFEGLSIHITRRVRNEMRGIRIIDDRDPAFHREVQAESGTVTRSADGQDLVLNLRNVRVDPFHKDRPVAGTIGAYRVQIRNALSTQFLRKRAKDMTSDELRAAVDDVPSHFPHVTPDEVPRQRLAMIVEINKRRVLSAACFAFVLLGSTLGIRSQRRESSIGIALSLVVMFCFFVFIALAETFVRYPGFHPEILIWMPVAVSLLLGLHLLRRLN